MTRYLLAFFVLTISASAQVTFPLQSAGGDSYTTIRYGYDSNLYVSGVFNRAIDFDPGPETHELDPQGTNSFFLVSYNPFGLFRWARLISLSPFNFYDYIDDADSTIYDDGWQDSDILDGFTNWFEITEGGSNDGYRELNSTTPLSGSRSFQIARSNSFYGIGRALDPWLFYDGQIRLLVRFDCEPTGNFIGFNLSRTTSSGTFGGGTVAELTSFGLTATNEIGITIQPYFSPTIFAYPTDDGDLRGDLLDFTINIRSNGNWSVDITNLSEPGTPTVSTNITLSPRRYVASIRFGSFMGGTNDILAFDNIRVKRATPESTATETPLLSAEPNGGIWVHGGFFNSIEAHGSTNNSILNGTGGMNGYAVLYDSSGEPTNAIQVTSNMYDAGSAFINSVVPVPDIDQYRFFLGTYTGGIEIAGTSIDRFSEPPDAPASWRAVWEPGDLKFLRQTGPDGSNTGHGAVAYDGNDYIRLNTSIGTNKNADVVTYSGHLNDFRFGGPGNEATCYDCLHLSDEGRLYYGGNYEQTVNFTVYDDLTTTYSDTNIIAISYSDIFIACSFYGDEVLSWVRSIGGADTNVLQGLAVDLHTNVIITGTFAGTMDMDGEAGSATLSSVATNGGTDGFVAKYDHNGNFIWAQRIGSDIPNTNNVSVMSIDTGPDGRSTLACEFTGDLNTQLFNTLLSQTNFGGGDIHIIQLDTDGNLAGPPITQIKDENGDAALSVGTRAGVNILIESSELNGTWNYVTNFTQTTGSVHVVTETSGYSNQSFRAVTDW